MRGRKKTKNMYNLDGHSLHKNFEGSKVRESTKKKTVKVEKRVKSFYSVII